MQKISIIVPAHNEEENLPGLVAELVPVLEQNAETQDFELVIVNDNSTDRTPAIIEELAGKEPRIKPVHRYTRPGFGNAIREGFKNASGDIIIPVMGDLSDDPEDIPKLIRKIEEGYDIAYGSRFIEGGGTDGYPEAKMIANRAFNNCVRLLFGIRHKDVTNAFKAYRREVLDSIGIDNLEASGFDLTVEIPLKAHIMGFTSVEVPVIWHGRKRGEAKLKLYENSGRYGKRLLKMFIKGNLVGLRDIFRLTVKGSLLHLVIATLIGILLIGSVFSMSGYSEVFQILSGVSYIYIALGLCCILLSFAIRTWRWSVLLRSSEYTVHRDTAFKCIMFGWFINYLIPARIGDFARAAAIHTTEKTPVGAGMSTIIFERILDLFTLAGVLAVTLVSYYSLARDFSGLLVFISLVLVLILSLLILLNRYDTVIINLLGKRFPSLGSNILIFNQSLKKMIGNFYAMVDCIILSVFVWVFEILAFYSASKAINMDLTLGALLFSSTSGFVSQAIPTTPAGIGVYEGSVAGIMYLLDIPLRIGISLALIDHFNRALIIYILGIISVIHIGFQSREYFRKHTIGAESINDRKIL